MLALCLLAVSATAGTAAPSVRIAVEVGFSGWIVPGVWIPIRVDVSSDQPLEGSLQVEIGPARYQRALAVPAGTPYRTTFHAVIPDPRRSLSVTIRDSTESVVARHTVPVPRERIVSGVVVAVSTDAAGLEFLAGGTRRRAGAYLTERDLPDHWGAYEGVDLVVLRDVDERATTERQRRALREWVAQGGRLVVTGERLLRQRFSWLTDLLPAEVMAAPAIVPANTLPGLGPQSVAVLRPRSGAVRQPSTGTPLVVSAPYGRGLVTIWAFDAFSPSVRAWSGRAALWRQVVPPARLQPLAHPGLIDVIPTARALSGLAQLQIIMLVVAYVLFVRLALRRFTPRPGGWLVLTAVVAVFTLALYATATHARRAASALVQVSVVEATRAANLARVTAYVAVLAPYGGPYVLAAPEEMLLRPLTAAAFTSSPDGALRGDAAPGVMLFEVVGMVPMPIAGAAVSTPSGIDLTVDNQTTLTLSAPSAYLNGQTHALPDIAGRASVTLGPGEWMPVDRNAATGDFARDVRAWIAARLDGYTAPAIIGYKTLWLLGEVRDPRLAVHLQGSGDQRGLDVLLQPMSVTGGR